MSQWLNKKDGFTLTELMIVVAIIGILAAISTPFYQRYVQKSKVSSLVLPTVHLVETNLTGFYSMRRACPSQPGSLTSFSADADWTYVSATLSAGDCVVSFQIESNATTSPLYRLHGMTLTATPTTNAGKILGWSLGGSLAEELGIR